MTFTYAPGSCDPGAYVCTLRSRTRGDAVACLSRPTPLRAEFVELESRALRPGRATDLARARKVGRRYAELIPIVKALTEYDRLTDDLAAARELAGEDPSFAVEAEELRGTARRR